MTLEQIVEIPIVENENKKKRGRKANTKKNLKTSE